MCLHSFIKIFLSIYYMHGTTVALGIQQRTTTIKRPWSCVVSTLVEGDRVNSLIYLHLLI